MISFTGAFILGSGGLSDLTQHSGAVEAQVASRGGTCTGTGRCKGMVKLRSHPIALLLAALPLVVLGACTQSAPPTSQESATSPEPSPLPTASIAPVINESPLTTPVPTASAAPSTKVVPDSEKGEKGARGVLLTWARALENRRFDVAWAQFLHPPAPREAFVEWWDRYETLTVAVPGGEMDAGAGSLYYTVPTTITGTTRDGQPFKLAGDVVLRRVNDVDGATPEQLHWHIGSADLKSVAP